MPKKSIWDSQFWKTVIAISTVLTIIVSFLTILQLLGKVDVYNLLLLLPIINFFTMPVPLYSIPLAFVVVLAILLILAYTGGSTTVTIGNPLARADILDSDYVRYIALMCRTPQTTDFLRQKYREFLNYHGISRAYSFEDCFKELEGRELAVFQEEKWTVTQKALDYIAKYHGD